MEEALSSSSYVFDSESPTEMARLINQDRMSTLATGGALSGIPEPSRLKNILDLGCGPGGWVLDMAFALPDAEVEGMDISRIMVNYANARALTQRLPNASFGVMDITHPLDFPDNAFDLVNARFLFSVLKQEMWPPFLQECRRVLRPGGLLRLTEPVEFGNTSSVAVNDFGALVMQAIRQAGYGFSVDGRSFGVTYPLPHLLEQQNFQQIRLQPHAAYYAPGTETWADQYHNVELIGYQMKPLFVKLGLITDDAFDQLHMQALADMQRETFFGMGFLLTVLAQKPAES